MVSPLKVILVQLALSAGGAGALFGAGILSDRMNKAYDATIQEAAKRGYVVAQFDRYADTNQDGIVSFDEETAFLRMVGYDDGAVRAYFAGETSKKDALDAYAESTSRG